MARRRRGLGTAPGAPPGSARGARSGSTRWSRLGASDRGGLGPRARAPPGPPPPRGGTTASPLFRSVGGIRPGLGAAQRRLRHCPVGRQPVPLDAHLLVVVQQPPAPDLV